MKRTHIRRRGMLAVARAVWSARRGRPPASSPALARPAAAADGERVATGPTAADFARLESEVRRAAAAHHPDAAVEQERYNVLLKLLQSGGQLGGTGTPAIPAPSPLEHGRARGAAPAAARRGARVEQSSAARWASVGGHVQSRAGALKDVYVYLDQVRGPPARGRTVEIKQKDKQFVPRVAVVQRGTSVVFPNLDAVYHNVFSTSGRNSLRSRRLPRRRDAALGRADDARRGRRLLQHPLAHDAPRSWWCRARSTPRSAPTAASGSRTSRSGTRKLVVWSPTTKPAQQKVEVSAAGARRPSPSTSQPTAAHLNKLGQPYGSYKE